MYTDTAPYEVVVILPNGQSWNVEVAAVDAAAAKYKVLFGYVKVTATKKRQTKKGREESE